jgi:hypothetical protein
VAQGFDRLGRTERVRIVRKSRFLASNEARNIGADGVQSEWIAFVENDIELSEGWLDRLIAAGERLGATTTYPAYLSDGPGVPLVHGLGAELYVSGPVGRQQLREHQHLLDARWPEVRDGLEPVKRVQSEPHTIAIRREFLERMGGFDEGLLSWFDHVDLALHHRRLGAAAWLIPDVTCTYRPPPPLRLGDLGSFNLRWSTTWYRRSLERLCEVWGLDPSDPNWKVHDRYRRSIRRRVPTPWVPLNAAIEFASAPMARVMARWYETRHSGAMG